MHGGRGALRREPPRRDMELRHRAGLTAADALAVLFIGLKLTGCISWSWWWVLAPLWAPLALALALLAAVVAAKALL